MQMVPLGEFSFSRGLPTVSVAPSLDDQTGGGKESGGTGASWYVIITCDILLMGKQWDETNGASSHLKSISG